MVQDNEWMVQDNEWMVQDNEWVDNEWCSLAGLPQAQTAASALGLCPLCLPLSRSPACKTFSSVLSIRKHLHFIIFHLSAKKGICFGTSEHYHIIFINGRRREVPAPSTWIDLTEETKAEHGRECPWCHTNGEQRFGVQTVKKNGILIRLILIAQRT